jgi:hypothetical protein
LTRIPDACAALFEGNRQALCGFTDEEAVQLVGLIERVIVNLDRIAHVQDAPHIAGKSSCPPAPEDDKG